MDSPHNQKKILYIITKSNFGGAGRYVLELATAMHTQGFAVAVACGGTGELVTRLQNAGITTFIIEGSQRDINFLKELTALQSLHSIIRNYNPDIVHLNSSKVGVLGSIAARICGVPKIIFTAHGWPFLEPRTKLWRTMAFIGSYLTSLLAHQVILVSQNDQNHTNMPGTAHKTTLIHTAVEHYQTLPRDEARQALFDAETIERHSSHVWLITHGEINHNKNHTTAIDAIAEFNSTYPAKVLYVIIGDGELTETIKEQVALKGQTEYVIFLKHVFEVRKYLLAFDIYLISSLKEGLPYSLLEAGISGLPCIASNRGGIPEVIIDKKTGLLINPDNHMTIVEALEYLLTNSDKRSEYSYALEQHLEQNFSLPDMIQKTQALY